MSRRIVLVATDRAAAEAARGCLEERGFTVDTIIRDGEVDPESIEVQGRTVESEDVQRLTTLGTMAAGAAHEMNNLLTPLTATLHTARRLAARARDGEAVAAQRLCAELSEASTCCDRLQELGVELLGFARHDQGAGVRPVQIHPLLEESLRLVASELRHAARVVRDYSQHLPEVAVEPRKLVQVFVNLLINAAHAVDGERDDNCVTLRTSRDGWRVRVDIEDNGAGIPAEILPRIFEPFYTTKRTDEGTGLGLAVSQGLVQAWAGEIIVHSEVGRGSCFSVLLPLAR